MQKKKINLALIAARKDSKGVKNKNLLKIKRKTITNIAVDIALKSKKIDKIVLSSDGDQILKSVPDNKKLTKLKRKKKLSLDRTPMMPVMQDAINYFEKKNYYKFHVENLIVIDPTSPLRKLSDINKSFLLFRKTKPDLLVSVHKAQHNPYFSMLEKKGKFYRLCKNSNFNPGSRQQVKEVFEINTIVWIYSRRAILKLKKRIPNKTILFFTPVERSIDIDNQNDIKLINYYLKK